MLERDTIIIELADDFKPLHVRRFRDISNQYSYAEI
jgi:cyclophilin family peptidyl-prolyl cis-trans isomerase